MTRSGSDVVCHGKWSLDVGRHLLHVDGKVARLQPGVMKLLLFLVNREGHVVTKADLVEAVWSGREVSDAAIYNRVSALRAALADDEGPDRCIQWEYGQGLRFARPERGSDKRAAKPGSVSASTSAHLNDVETVPQPWFNGAVAASDWRHLLGTYHLFYRTPSWPDAIKIGVSVLTEANGRIAVHTIEQGHDENIGIRQNARYSGHAEFIDGRVYVFEQNRQPPRSVCLTVLDAPHSYRPNMMTGMMMGSSWRLRGEPYATRVVWHRLPSEVTLRDAIRQSGPCSDGEGIDPDVIDCLGPHCLTFNDSRNTELRSVASRQVLPQSVPRITARTRSGPSVVAVLPFETMTEEPMLRHLANGMAKDITAQLSKFRDVRVAARNAALSAGTESISIKDLADKHGVDFVLEGSLRPTGQGIRITSHLIDAELETQIWANNYELSSFRMSESHDEATRSIIASVVTVLNECQLAAANGKAVEDLSPWECYLRGCAIMHTFDPHAQEDAVAIFQRGIDLDPGFADLYAAMSYARNTQYKLPKFFQNLDTRGSRQTSWRLHAHNLAKKALEIDPRTPFAWVALGRSHLGLGEIDEAISAARRALELNQNLGWAHFLLGYCYWPMNRGNEALEAFDRAFEALSEDSFRWTVIEGKACALMVAGYLEDAVETANRAQIEPRAGHFAHCAEICSLSHLGRKEEAQRALERALDIDSNFGLTMIEHDQPLPDPAVRMFIADGLTIAKQGRARAEAT